MAKTRYYSGFVSSAAGNSITGTDITGLDDFQVRNVVGLHVGGNTAHCLARLVLAGQMVAEVDTTAFSAANGPLELNERIAAGLIMHVDINNLTGSAVTNIAIVIKYQVPD